MTLAIIDLWSILESNVFAMIIYPSLSGVVIWFVSKKRYQEKDLKDRDVNTESNQSEIVSKNLELYQRMLDDIEKRYEERIFKSDKEKEELEQIIKELKQIISELEQALIESRNLNYELEVKTKKFVNEIINLKGRLEEYENEN